MAGVVRATISQFSILAGITRSEGGVMEYKLKRIDLYCPDCGKFIGDKEQVRAVLQ